VAGKTVKADFHGQSSRDISPRRHTEKKKVKGKTEVKKLQEGTGRCLHRSDPNIRGTLKFGPARTAPKCKGGSELIEAPGG